jgi:hypothetical protein
MEDSINMIAKSAPCILHPEKGVVNIDIQLNSNSYKIFVFQLQENNSLDNLLDYIFYDTFLIETKLF